MTVTMALANLEALCTAIDSPCSANLGPNTPTEPGPIVWAQWSNNRGKSFLTPVAQTAGFEMTLTQMQWRRTGYARDRVFELIWTTAGPTAINGAYIDVESMKT